MSGADLVAKQVAISVQMDTVTLELICGDDYAAQVLYDDLIQRLRAGEGISISMQQPPSLLDTMAGK